MTGSLGLGANLTRWSAAEMEAARQYIATYKSIRETVQHGDLYRLASLRHGDWSALEYVAADGAEAVVFVFLQASRFGPSRRSLRLEGLDPEAQLPGRRRPAGVEWSGAHGTWPDGGTARRPAKPPGPHSACMTGC